MVRLRSDLGKHTNILCMKSVVVNFVEIMWNHKPESKLRKIDAAVNRDDPECSFWGIIRKPQKGMTF